MNSIISHIEYALPEKFVTNDELTVTETRWTSEKILQKTGIAKRFIVDTQTTASDLAFQAATKIVDSAAAAETIDLLVFCTQSPDYVLPTTACLLQHRLGLPTSCAAFDFNLGCSGYVYGLSIVKSMIQTGQAKRALLLTGETYSKYFDRADFSVASIFGDAGTATLIDAVNSSEEMIGPFIYGTDGSGGDRLIVGSSGARPAQDDLLLARVPEAVKTKLFMDGPEIFAFTMRTIQSTLETFFEKYHWTWDTFDWIVFHQANKFMLDNLRIQCSIPAEKFIVRMKHVGNTVSNTIPIVLADLQQENVLKSGDRLLLVGFGVGYSWAACSLTWQ